MQRRVRDEIDIAAQGGGDANILSSRICALIFVY